MEPYFKDKTSWIALVSNVFLLNNNLWGVLYPLNLFLLWPLDDFYCTSIVKTSVMFFILKSGDYFRGLCYLELLGDQNYGFSMEQDKSGQRWVRLVHWGECSLKVKQ